jgi:hypothetical protein
MNWCTHTHYIASSKTGVQAIFQWNAGDGLSVFQKDFDKVTLMAIVCMLLGKVKTSVGRIS